MIEFEVKLEVETKNLELAQIPNANDYLEFSSRENIKNFLEKNPPRNFQVQNDIYYSHPKRDLKARDELLRNRISINYARKKKHWKIISQSNLITFKGPQKGGAIKSREEIEFEANPLLWNVFSKLDYFPSFSMKKHRWECCIERENHEVLFHFDKVEGLGFYLEVEIVSSEMESKQVEWVLESVLSDFEIDDLKKVKKSYVALLQSL